MSHLADYCTTRFCLKVGIFAEEQPDLLVFGSESMYRLNVDSPRTGRKPDASVLRVDQLPDGKIPITTFKGRPTLAFESISPHDNASEVERKVAEYVAAGVPLIWVLYPLLRTGRVVAADGSTRLLSESDAFDGGDVLPGLKVPLGSILPPPEMVEELKAADDEADQSR